MPNRKMESRLKFLKNDESDTTISSRGIAVCVQVAAFYPVADRVVVYQTLHGHIAEFMKKPGTYVPGRESQPARLNAKDAVFFSGLEGLRWFEVTCGVIRVAFEN